MAEPFAAWLFPAGQSTHVVVSTASAARYLPTTHDLQAADTFSAYMPGAHLAHPVAPLTGPVVLSGSHTSQDVAACLLTDWPGAQSSHFS